MIVALVGLRLDHAGISRILKSDEVDDALGPYADQIEQFTRENVDEDVPVNQRAYTTDRRARSVAIAHPTGIALQARHGILTRAAASAGLEVRQR